MALAVLALVAANRLPAQAADLAEQAHSLRKVPADAAFYSSSLRLKEQWDAFVGSKAYGKLMEIPLVQLAKMQVDVSMAAIERAGGRPSSANTLQSPPGKMPSPC